MHSQLRQAIVWGCVGWLSSCPNFGVRSNNLPLAFGMTPQAASYALGAPLTPVATGRHGSSILYAEDTAVTTMFTVAQRQRLWMQFRDGRLSGWKYEWDRPMAW
jgi:hypothetical protein